MITNISVTNFKVLQKLENVKLNKITLIGGKNNSGKSSLLEALFLYVDRKSSDVLLRLLDWRQLSEIQITSETIWAPFFFNFSLSDVIEIKVTRDLTKQSELQVAFQENYTPKIPIPINNNGVLNSQAIGGTAYRSLSIAHISINEKFEQNIDFFGHTLINGIGMYHEIEKNTADAGMSIFYMGSRMLLDVGNVERLGKLDKNDEQDKILPLLQRIEPGLRRFQVIKEGKNDVIYADLGNKRKVPVNLLGDGFCRCLTIVLLLVADTIDLLLLDEAASGIHYSFLDIFWQFIFDAAAKFNCQIIATTHSYEMLQGFCKTANNASFDDISYIRLEKNTTGIEAHQYTKSDLSYALSSDWEVR